ncbi:MAG TPA: YaiI/YqxD family protein [Lysobacter sp.]
MSDAPRIWVDADACPGPVRDIVVRAANRAQVQAVFVANQWIRLPTSPWLRAIQVAQGPDEADDAIAAQLAAGDLVVTQDIPLAVRAIEAGAAAMDPRGEVHTKDTIAQRLSMRNFMDELRGAGVQTGGPAAFHARDRQAFAAGLDRWLARLRR